MEENSTPGEDGLDRSGGEQAGSMNSFIQSLRVAGEESLEKKIKKVCSLVGSADLNKKSTVDKSILSCFSTTIV